MTVRDTINSLQMMIEVHPGLEHREVFRITNKGNRKEMMAVKRWPYTTCACDECLKGAVLEFGESL